MKGMMKATLQRQSTQNGNLPGKPFEKFGMEAYKGLPHTNSSGSKSLGYSGSTDVEDFELEDCRRQHILLSRLSSLSIGSHIESECDFLESSLDSDVRSCSAPVKLTSKPSLSLIDTSTETTNTFESITPLDSPYDLGMFLLLPLTVISILAWAIAGNLVCISSLASILLSSSPR